MFTVSEYTVLQKLLNRSIYNGKNLIQRENKHCVSPSLDPAHNGGIGTGIKIATIEGIRNNDFNPSEIVYSGVSDI